MYGVEGVTLLPFIRFQPSSTPTTTQRSNLQPNTSSYNAWTTNSKYHVLTPPLHFTPFLFITNNYLATMWKTKQPKKLQNETDLHEIQKLHSCSSLHLKTTKLYKVMILTCPLVFHLLLQFSELYWKARICCSCILFLFCHPFSFFLVEYFWANWREYNEGFFWFLCFLELILKLVIPSIVLGNVFIT